LEKVIFNQSLAKRRKIMKGQTTLKLFKDQVRGKLFSLLLSWGLLLLIALIALTGCVSAVPEEGEQEQVESAAPVIEEVQVPSEDKAVSETTRLAENPELMAAGRYEATRADEGMTGSAFFAENPELMVADRYEAPIVEKKAGSRSAFFAANPELMAAGRYEAPTIDDAVMSDSTFFASNPELMAADRYSAKPTMTDSDILAENPELKVVRQYEAALKK
jgi:hypothetical protein